MGEFGGSVQLASLWTIERITVKNRLPALLTGVYQKRYIET